MYKLCGLTMVILFTNFCNGMDLGDARDDFNNIVIPNIVKMEKKLSSKRKCAISEQPNLLAKDEEINWLLNQKLVYKEKIDLPDELFGLVLKKMKNK